MNAIRGLPASIAIIALGVGAAAAEPAAIGAVDKLQGQADATQAERTRGLAVDAELLFRDRCHSGAGARLQATLKDGTKLTMGENATLTIDEFVYKPGQSAGELSVKVAKGAFLYVGGLVEGEPGAKVQIRTPVAALGVRGTTVWGGPIDKGYGVFVLNGEVTVTGKRGRVTLRQGQGTMLFASGKPQRATAWRAAKVDRAIATVSFAPPQAKP